MFNVDVERDLPNQRAYSFGEKNKLFLRREDPYGFWRFSLERGFVPKEIDGTFTSVMEAEKVLNTFLTEKKKEEVRILK